MVSDTIAKTGEFELKKSVGGYFLYWLNNPIKHLTDSEADDLTALMNVPRD